MSRIILLREKYSNMQALTRGRRRQQVLLQKKEKIFLHEEQA